MYLDLVFKDQTYEGSVANKARILINEDPESPAPPEEKLDEEDAPSLETPGPEVGIGSFMLSFDLNGGEGPVPSQKLKVGGKAQKPNDPSWGDHKFLGWNRAREGVGEIWDPDSFRMPSADVTVYARWDKIESLAEKSEPPTINPVHEDDKTVSGDGVPGSEIVVTFPNGGTATATVDEDGRWTVNVPEGVNLKSGDELTAVQTEPGKTPSDPAKQTVSGNSSGNSGGGSGGDGTGTGNNNDNTKDDDTGDNNTGETEDTQETDNAPGGNDRDVPPNPTVPGHGLTPGPNGTWIELGEDGLPLGEWHWDEPTEQWVFDEYPPPLANLPQTGAVSGPGEGAYAFFFLLALLSGAASAIRSRATATRAAGISTGKERRRRV
jgi:hypothetical protein